MEPTETGTSALTDWLDDHMERTFAVIQRLLIAGVAVALVILSVTALWDTVVVVHDQLARNDLTRAITLGVDTVFLTVILLELLHTVIGREPLWRQAPDFIIIGITSAIRHGLSLVATGGRGAPSTGASRDVVISLGINSGSVLLLVAALWLVRHSFLPNRDQVNPEIVQ